MVGVASHGRAAAAGEPAGPVADVDQVPQRPAGPVRAWPDLSRASRGIVTDTSQVLAAAGGGWPRSGAGAAVHHGPPVLAGQGQAPPGTRPGREPLRQVPAGIGIHRPEPGHLAGRVGAAKPR